MRLTIEEAANIQDQLESYLFSLIGQDVQFRRNPDVFSVELLRKQKRPNLDPKHIIGGPDSRRTYELAPHVVS